MNSNRIFNAVMVIAYLLALAVIYLDLFVWRPLA